MDCCVRGYHIFKLFWDAPIGSILSAKHEDDPQSLIHDKYAIALINSESITVGHLPRFMSKLAHVFVKHAWKLGVKLQVQKDRAGWFGDSSKNNISEFKQKNNWWNEKETCSSYQGI